MRSINLIAASRGRPKRMYDVLYKWIKNSKFPEKISSIISIDEDDDFKKEYLKKMEELQIETGVKIEVLINENKNTVQAINRCKNKISADLIFVISDDTDCFKDWDYSINSLIEKSKDYYIIKTDDGIGKDLITMPIFSRKYVDSKEYIYYTEYEHMFCDTELTCVAHLEGCVIDASHLTFNHLHYTKGYHQKDTNDEKNQNTFYSGMDIFRKRLNLNFGVPEEKQKGKIPENIIEYINNN